MPSALLLPLVLAVQAVPADEPAIRLSVFPRTIVRYGAPVTVTAEPARDGFLTVLRVDTYDRVHILFPAYPGDDAFVRAGEIVHVRDPWGGNEAFIALERDGDGTVLAALSEEPYDFGEFASGRFWSNELTGLRYTGRDHTESLLELVESMAGQAPFDYAVASYWVAGRSFAYSRASRGYGACDALSRFGFWDIDDFGSTWWLRQTSYRSRWYYGLSIHDPFDRFWFGDYRYDPWCYDRYGPGFWSRGPRMVVIGGPGFPGRPVDRTGLKKKKKGDIVKAIEPRRRQPGTDVATDRPVVARPVKERAKPGVDTRVARERARPTGDRGVVRQPIPHTPNRDVPQPRRRDDPSPGGNSGGAIHREKPPADRPQPIRPERPSTPPPAIQKPAEKPAEKPKN
jgi:hypothetical protein